MYIYTAPVIESHYVLYSPKYIVSEPALAIVG